MSEQSDRNLTEVKRIPGLGKRIKLVLAGMAAVTAVTGACGLNKSDQGDFLKPALSEAPQAKTELNFLDWYRMPREAQEATALFLEGKDVVLNVNTPDLRLHTKLINPDHVLVDLNIPLDKELLPPAGSNYSGKPVEMRLTTDQYDGLRKDWGTASTDNDITVPVGTKLNVRPQQLFRGDSPQEITTQLVFQGSTK